MEHDALGKVLWNNVEQKREVKIHELCFYLDVTKLKYRNSYFTLRAESIIMDFLFYLYRHYDRIRKIQIGAL
jgi:hypothetical protein